MRKSKYHRCSRFADGPDGRRCAEFSGGGRGLGGQFDKIEADPGPHNVIRQYVEWTLERNALQQNEAVLRARGEHDRADVMRQQAARLDVALMNFQREEPAMGPRQFDEAHNLLARIQRGARVLWRPYGERGMAGFRGGSKMPLSEAGYRERAFFKSWLAQQGRGAEWPQLSRTAKYDPHHDVIYFGRNSRVEVRWEGGESDRILRGAGLDDRDCLGCHEAGRWDSGWGGDMLGEVTAEAQAREYVNQLTRSGEAVRFETPHSTELYQLKKAGRGSYVLGRFDRVHYRYKEPTRWGSKQEIIEDLVHLLEYGALPAPGRRG